MFIRILNAAAAGRRAIVFVCTPLIIRVFLVFCLIGRETKTSLSEAPDGFSQHGGQDLTCPDFPSRWRQHFFEWRPWNFAETFMFTVWFKCITVSPSPFFLTFMIPLWKPKCATKCEFNPGWLEIDLYIDWLLTAARNDSDFSTIVRLKTRLIKCWPPSWL